MPAAASDDWIDLHDEPVPIERVVSFVSAAPAGGIDLFLGTTREETDPAGRRLMALDYEAYREMATSQLRDLAARARRQWPIARLALLHRVGRVPVGQPSVIIGVATPHRAEAFAACRWLIDTLKAEAAIWKKEIWHDGAETWKGEGDQEWGVGSGG
jgi:molybdopterin synthase catalytic subunit